jgi:phosphonate transport system substrate-binding protein
MSKLLFLKNSIQLPLISILLLAISSTAWSQDRIYSFGVVPQQSTSALAKTWIPILDYIQKHSGISLQFKTDSSIPKFEQKLTLGEYDFAYMNPYHYVIYHNKVGYQAFAKAANKQIKGIIVVHKDNPATTLQELAGANIAFPAPAAFAATILPLKEFNRLGIKAIPSYVNSHDSVYANVSLRRFIAGGGVIRTLKNTLEKYRENLKILWVSKGYTPHAFASHSKVPHETTKRIQKAFTDMNNDEKGRMLLQTLKVPDIEIAHDRDWNDVRALDIQLLK